MKLAELLADPPWLKPRSPLPAFPAAKDIHVRIDDARTEVVWGPYEREAALAVARRTFANAQGMLAMPDAELAATFNALRPEALVEENASDALDPIVARLGAKASVGLAACARTPALRARAMQLLAHVGTPRAVPVMIDAATRLPSLRRRARRWLSRFSNAALEVLVPLACGTPAEQLDLVLVQKPAEAMAAAGAVLRFLERTGHGPEIASRSTRLGLDAPVARVLAEDELLGRKQPELRPALVALHGDRRFLEWLALLDWEAPVLLDVRDTISPSALDETMRALLAEWIATQAVAPERWALYAAIELGGQQTRRALVDVLRKWKAAYHTPSKDVVRAVGAVAVRNFGQPVGDGALEVLAEIAVKGSSASQERFARETIAWVDEELEEVDDLEDRIVPTLGFGARSRVHLDYGARAFEARLDPTLEIRLTDETGASLDRLPAPRKADDAEMAKQAKARLAALTKSTRALATSLVERMKTALRTDRRWSAAAFEHLVLKHPVVSGVARGLVWAAHGPAGVLGTFRVCEDSSLADQSDRPMSLPPNATVSVAHPALIDADAWSRWAAVLADHEILSPFDQLGWPVVRLTEAERKDTRLSRFEGATLDRPKLIERGWWHGPDAPDTDYTLERRLPRGLRVMVFHRKQPYSRDKLHVSAIRLQRLEELGWERYEPFGVLDPVTASELVLELSAA